MIDVVEVDLPVLVPVGTEHPVANRGVVADDVGVLAPELQERLPVGQRRRLLVLLLLRQLRVDAARPGGLVPDGALIVGPVLAGLLGQRQRRRRERLLERGDLQRRDEELAPFLDLALRAFVVPGSALFGGWFLRPLDEHPLRAAALLDDVRRLVRHQRQVRLRLAGAEPDVLSVRERPRLDGLRGRARRRVLVHAHAAQIDAHPRLERLAGAGLHRLAGPFGLNGRRGGALHRRRRLGRSGALGWPLLLLLALRLLLLLARRLVLRARLFGPTLLVARLLLLPCLPRLLVLARSGRR